MCATSWRYTAMPVQQEATASPRSPQDTAMIATAMTATVHDNHRGMTHVPVHDTCHSA